MDSILIPKITSSPSLIWVVAAIGFYVLNIFLGLFMAFRSKTAQTLRIHRLLFYTIAFCLGYIAGELCVSLISYFYSRKKLENLFILSNFAKFAMDLMIVILASLVFKYISEISTHTLIKVTIPIIVYFPLLILLIKEDFKIFEEKI